MQPARTLPGFTRRTQALNLSVLTVAALAFGMLTSPAVGGVSAAAAPEPTVKYTFDGTLTDANGASTLTAAPPCPGDPCNASAAFGSDANGTYWTWSSTDARGGGFTLDTTADIGSSYTIALRFSSAEVSGYRKIIDYKDRASDNGFYFLDGVLLFYPFADQSMSTYPADTVLDLIAVREATGPLTGTFTVYAVGADGALTHLFTADDTNDESVAVDNGSGGTLLGFFFDDIVVAPEAMSSGKVYDLRIWANRALTAEELEAALLPAPAPVSVVTPPVVVVPAFTG